MVTMKWSDTTERMMLLKLLEQNLTTKLNVEQALATWPKSIGLPTKRSLVDRFNLVKKHIKDGTTTPSLGQGSVTTTTPVSRPPATPKTPRSTSKTSKVKVRADEEGSDDDNDHHLPSTTPNPISNAKGSSSKEFEAKLRGSLSTIAATTPSRSTKRKREASEEEEPSMSSNAATSTSENDAPSPTKSTASRRSIPRRSKSKTPRKYTAPESSETEAGSVNAESDEDNSEDMDGQDDRKKANGVVKRKHRVAPVEDDDSDAGVSDEGYDLICVQNRGKNKDRKKKALWQEIVAKQDGLDFDMDDMED